MSDKVATFWIVTEQNKVFNFGEQHPRVSKHKFSFPLTEENYNSWAYITLSAKGVDFEQNRLLLNDKFIGNLDLTPSNLWVQQTFIVEVYSTQLFGVGKNELLIESRNEAGGTDGNLDDFSVKHIVFHYRTRR